MVQQKTLRVIFEKTGKLQYISHLDLLRTMQTALRRAKVKMIYSEGFNPHMKINFALPLSIGIESVCEIMDLRTEENVDPEQLKLRLAVNLPRDMRVLNVYEAQTKLTDIKYAEYAICLDYGDQWEKAAEIGNRIFNSPLIVTKRTKKGERDIDIQPMIRSVEVRGVYGMVVINCVLCADSENYLNPFYLAGALDKEMGYEAHNRKVMRMKILTADGTSFL